MEALLYLLPALGCGLMMVACMYLMGRGMRSKHQEPSEGDTDRQVAELRGEVRPAVAVSPRSPRVRSRRRRPVRRSSGSRGDPPGGESDPEPAAERSGSTEPGLWLVPPPAKRQALLTFGCIPREMRS